MATTIAQLVATISAETSGFTKGVQDAQDKTEGFKGTLKDIGKSAAGFALAQVGVSSMSDVLNIAKDTLGGWLKGAEDAQVATERTNQILSSGSHIMGLNADAVDKVSESLSNMTGVDDDAIHAGANIIAGFSAIPRQAFEPVMQSAVDMAAAMKDSGMTVESASTLIGRALQDPAKGARLLRQANVILSESQQKQIQDFEKSGNMAGAQGVIMDALKKKVGGAADAYGGTTEGKIQKFHTTLDNLGKGVMANLLPALGKMVDIGTQVVSFFQNGGEPAHILAGILGGILVVAALAYAASMASAAVATIAATWPILAIIAAVGLLVAGFKLAYDHIGPFRFAVDLVKASIGQAIDVIKNIVGWLGEHLGPILQKVGGFLSAGFHLALLGLKTDFDAVSSVVQKVIGWIGNLLGKLGQVKDAIGNALGGAGNLLSRVSGFAEGTQSAPGGLAMVGEHGPELMYVPQGARIYPHGQGPSVGSVASRSLSAAGGAVAHTTIVLEIDGRQFAAATVPHIAGVVRARGGIRM